MFFYSWQDTPIQNIMIMESYCLLIDVWCPTPFRPFSCPFCTFSYYPALRLQCLRLGALRFYTVANFFPYTVLKMSTIFPAYFCTICQGNTRSLSCNSAAGKQSFDYFPFALRLATLKLIWHYRWNQALPKRDFLQPFRKTLIVWEISASSRILRFHCSFIFQVNDDVSVMVIQ